MSEHRLRALVLAVLMVTSVVAGSGVALAGGASGNSTLVVDAAGNAQQDGVYNDIQPAVDAATAGDTVEVEATGTYDPFTVKKKLTVTAAGDTAPEVTGDGPAVVQVEGAGGGTTISGLKLTGTATLGVEVRADGTTVENNVISVSSTGVQTQDDAVNGDGLDGVVVANNEISGSLVGVSVTENAGKTVTVRDNEIADVTVEGIGVAGTAEVIEGNDVTADSDVPGVRFYGGVPSEVNGVTGDRTDIATAVLTDNDGISSVAFEQSGETVSRAVENIDTGTYYASIQTAVDDAESGATISVASGTYQEAVTIGKNLTLVGAGPNETTITTDSGPTVLVEGHTPDAGDAVGSVTLKGFTAVAGSGGSGIATYGETAESDYDTKSLTVENVHVDGSAGYGVTLTSTAEATLTDVSITGVGSDTVGAVEAVGVGDLTITDSTVSDNGVGVNVFTVDDYGAVDSVSITDTTFSGNTIHVQDATGAVDTGAVVANNDLAGAVTASPTTGETAIWASIQPAIDAADAGTTVEIGPGTYNESLDIRKNLTLAGSGEGETAIEAGGFDDYGLSTTANVTLRDFTLGGPTVDAAYAYGIKAQFASLPDGNYARTDVTIEDVTVRNSDKTEIDLNGVGSASLVDVTAAGNGTGGAGIALSDTRDVTIENATTTGNGWGAVAVYTNGGYAVPAGTDGVTFAGDNSFENSVYLQGDLSLITNVEVPADATHEVTYDQGGYVGYFDSQADAEAFVAAADSPDSFLIRSLDDSDGEDGDTYTVAENQSVADTVSQVPAGSTVVVNKSSIDSAVTISKPITLVAGDGSSGSASISTDTTADSTDRPTVTSTLAIDNYADDVTVEGFAFDLDAGGRINADGAGDDLTIRNNVFTGGSSDNGVAAAVSHGGASSGQGTTGARTGWVVADNEFRDIDGQALRLWNLQSLTIEDNEFSNLTYSAVSHLGVADTTIRENSFTDIGRSGVYVDSVDSISPLGVSGVSVENNTFENVGAPDGQYDQGGVNVGANVGDLSEITVRANDFFGGQYGVHVANESQDATGTVDAGLNYWNASSGPSGLGDGTGVRITAGVQYSPILPNETSTYEDVTDVQSATYDVVVPADGESRVVAFPMDVNGTVGDVFGNFDGNLWAWNATSDSWDRVEDPSREIDALDAFVVSLDENASDLRVTFTAAPAVGDEPGVPPEATLDAGWNLVGAPQFGESGSAFGASTADPARVLKTYRGPTGEPFAPGFESATGVVGDTDAVSPFEGYWVYATEDGTLAGNVPPGTDATELEDLLKEA